MDTLVLIALTAMAGALLRALIVGPLGVLPPTAIALWQAWRSHQQARTMRRDIDLLIERARPNNRDLIERLQKLSRLGRG